MMTKILKHCVYVASAENITIVQIQPKRLNSESIIGTKILGGAHNEAKVDSISTPQSFSRVEEPQS